MNRKELSIYNMETNQKHLQDLAEIKSLMEKSSRFLSLSGLSGVFAGSFAIFGALNVWLYTRAGMVKYDHQFRGLGDFVEEPVLRFMLINAAIVLFLSLLSAWYFSKRKANRMNLPLWNPASKRMLLNLLIPLITGGVLCVILMIRQDLNLIAPLMLLFYGLALINAGKYTEDSINYLGFVEIITGLLAVVFINHSLLFWTLGFGVWHIIYGVVMYYLHKKSW